MTKIKSMGKIVAVSAMSVLVSISFNGCGFLKSTGNKALASLGNTAQQGISSLGNTAEKGISNALSSESKSSSSKAKVANNENDKGKCSGNEIKTDTSIEKGECKGGKRNGVWKYYDNYGYIQKEITFQNGEMTLEKVYDKDENLKYMTRYNKGKPEYERVYTKGKLSIFTYSKIDSTVVFGRSYEIEKLIWQIEARTREAKNKRKKSPNNAPNPKSKSPQCKRLKTQKTLWIHIKQNSKPKWKKNYKSS